MNPNYQKLAIWAALFVLLLALYNLVSNPSQLGAPTKFNILNFSMP